jgi:hypothetical protein
MGRGVISPSASRSAWPIDFLRRREQAKLLQYLGRREETGHRRNHDLKRLQRKQDAVSDQLELGAPGGDPA